VTLRRRLTVWYGAAIAATLIAFGALVWFQFGRSLRASLDQTLQVQAADVRAALRAGDEASIVRLDPAQPGIFTAVFDARGRIMRASPGVPVGLEEPSREPTTQTVEVNGQAYTLVALGGSAGRTILTGSSLAPVDSALESLARLELVVTAFGIVLSLAGGSWLAGRALAPVDVLTREADTIGLDDLDRRLPESGQLDEIGRLARTLNAMLDRVRGAVRRERTIIAAVSHDLRTPIAALQAELELANDPSIGRDELLVSIRAAHGDAVRLGNLTTDLLTLAESEAGGRELLRESIPVDALVDSTLARVTAVAAGRSIELEARAPTDRVRVDRVRIEQALANLLSNAVRIAPQGSTVEVVAAIDDDPPRALTVSVLDRGPGVGSEMQRRLFVPFGVRAEPGGRAGLGLATAAAAVRAHGGEIGYRDRPGGGGIFWFCVPA
jgi:signal transduction histidine kinase